MTIKNQVIQEIEALSGYKFDQFKERMNEAAYDTLMVTKEIKEKYGRWCTQDFLMELGFKRWPVKLSSTIRKSDIKWMRNGLKQKLFR